MFFCSIYYEKLEWNNLFMTQVCVATPCVTLHVLKGSTKWNSVSVWVKSAGQLIVCEVAEKKCYLEQEIGDS